MEYADAFERTHDYVKSDGTRIPLADKIASVAHHQQEQQESMQGFGAVAAANEDPTSADPEALFQSRDLVDSVLIADGIHHHVHDDLVKNMPNRVKEENIKARMTWFGALCLAGIGMFVEAYIIITTGQVKTVWHDQYPVCFIPDDDANCPQNIACCGLFPNTPSFENGTCAVDTSNSDECNSDGTYKDRLTCTETVVDSVSYTEFAGLMFGMLVFGALADVIGRKRAGMMTGLIMLTGIILMTLYKDPNDNIQNQVLVFATFFGVFGLGVGGEYPLSASGAAEHHAEEQEEALLDDKERHRRRILAETAKTARRGETISLAFAMQGVGAVFGSFILLLLIYFSDQMRVTCDDESSNSSGNDPHALNGVWRSFYMLGFVFVVMLLLYRSLVLEEGKGHEKMMERKARREEKLRKIGNPDSPGFLKILRFYGPRMIGTGLTWFPGNVAFYGLKLFSGPIFDEINPGGDLIVQNGWLLFNNMCALLGYYASAAVIDNPRIGRYRLQLMSFGVSAFLFILTGAVFHSAGSSTLMFLYFASSFFANFGVNTTTFVMAAETYPAELRATCHGISAFCGKAGALTATIVFSSLSTQAIFFVCGGVSIIGFLVCFVFSVDLTRVSMAEHDAQLELFLEGRPEAYKGKLNERKHLSFYEIWTGRHGEFEPNWARKLVDDEKNKSLRLLGTTAAMQTSDDSTSQAESDNE